MILKTLFSCLRLLRVLQGTSSVKCVQLNNPHEDKEESTADETMNLAEYLHRSGKRSWTKDHECYSTYFQLKQISPGPAAPPQLNMPTHAEGVLSCECRAWVD